MNKFFFSIILLFLFTSCSNVKDALQGKKYENSDEFLVIKKNPLVLPPEFSELPTPDSENSKKESSQLNTVKELISDNKAQTTQSQSSTSNEKIEQNILKKIKNK